MEKIICDFCKKEPVDVVEISLGGEVTQCCSACYEENCDEDEVKKCVHFASAINPLG